MAVTLADVAARAGVSAATVSRVLNGNYPVAGATRARVLRVVDELQYVVNGNARALAAATSDLVGILVHDVADPFFGLIASGIQAETGGDKLAVICNTGGSPERELNYLTLLQRQRAAGVVLTGGAVDDPDHAQAVANRLSRLTTAGTRVVLCGRPPLPEPTGGNGAPITAAITFDNRGGARALAEHLISLGHRRIAYIMGPAHRTTTQQRLEGHHEALAAHGIDGDNDKLTVHGDFERSSGYDAALELLRRDPELTAIVAANDTMALGACAALRERGLRIPADVSVAGFDDLPFSVDAVPALTTVRIPLYEAGTRAGRLVVGSQPAPPGGVATVRAELMVRASAAPPRAR